MAQITPPPRPEPAPDDIRVETSGVGAVETAAATAVVLAALEEQVEHAVAGPDTPSGWERGRRALRTPLRPGPGAWRDSLR